MSEQQYTKYTERPASLCIFEAGNNRDPGHAVKQEAKEQLYRFINDTINHREPSEGDKQAAADALIAAMSGTDLQSVLGLKRQHGQHGKNTLDPDHVYINDPLFEIVRRLYGAKDISYREATGQFMSMANVSERTAQRCIAAIRPRAEQTHRSLMALKLAGEDTQE